MSPAPHADRDHSESPDTIRAAARLCDDDGTVRSGAMHHGQDYECTGSAHFDGIPIECTNPVHSAAPKYATGGPVRGDSIVIPLGCDYIVPKIPEVSGLAEALKDAATLRAERDRARSLAATLEARLAQVEALAARWESARTWDDKPAIVDRCFGADLRGVIGPKGDA